MLMASSDIEFTLDRSGGADILKNNNVLQEMQKSAMQEVLTNIEAQFFQTFGVQGTFKLTEFTTDRSSVKIGAADSKTAAVLKRSPGWLNTFINNITI